MEEELRLYTFTNCYLQGIQVGIQSAHVLGELAVKYINNIEHEHAADNVFHRWAKNHKTMICLNGGNNAMLHAMWVELSTACIDLDLPCAKFHEDEQSMAGMLTSIGAVLPAHIFEAAANIRKGDDPDAMNLNRPELAIIDILNQCGLAR